MAAAVARPVFILASASPRRRELLAALGLPFVVQVADVPEPLVEGVPVGDQAEHLALAKAEAIRSLMGGGGDRGFLPILAADTIVALDGKPLGKPEDAGQAASMLRGLRGRAHQVITGIAVEVAVDYAPSAHTTHVTTTVTMRAYSDAEIAAYIATGDPFDKAGGYAIQHRAFGPVERIDGCYCNVMGLPLWTVRSMLAMAATLTADPPDQQLSRCHDCPLAEPPSWR